ncbi:MAG: PLP-dependent aminotransferase family protein [Aeromicrobium erythreum]
MQTTSGPPTLPLRLDRTADVPLATQLATGIRRLVGAGTLRRGTRLPASRALAVELGVSRAVVTQAYEQLVAEGWLDASHGSGTFVAGTATAPPPSNPPPSTSTPRGAAAPAEPTLVRLDTGTPWIDPRHRAGWRRAWRDVAAAVPPAGYDDPCGIPALRAALAERLGRLRGVDCDPDEVVVTHGTTDGLRALLEVLPAGAVAVEDPGYRAAVATVRAAGRRVVDVPACGVPVVPPDVVATYVTPAHQHPLGHVMPAADRVALLAAATAQDAVVVEDDYDSEFRYDVAPVPALASLDRSRVAYLGTASKSVSPSLRLGWLVPPPHLLDAVRAARAVRHESVSWPVQRAFLSMLRDGYVDRVVRSARRVYADRAPRVAAVLAAHAEPAGPSAGMYSTWLLPPDRALAAHDAARAVGFDVPLLTDYTRGSTLAGLVIGFGGVSDVELDTALDAIARGLDDRRDRRRRR